MSSAADWTQALADTLLPVDVSAGRPVRLDCDDAAITAAGVTLGIARAKAVDELVSCLHAEELVYPDRGVGPLVGVGFGQPPGYLLGLAVLVLAASRMAHDEQGSMAAYYRRLSELLQIPLQPTWPQIRGVPELVERFADLSRWMIEQEGGRRGLLDLPTEVQPSVVGVPIHQSLLRAGDRIVLGVFFERTSRLIDAGWDPVNQLARWGGRHQLSASLQALLVRSDLHQALAGVLRAARHSWDGSTVDEAGHRLVLAELAVHLPPGPFAISARVPALSSPVEVTGPDGSVIALNPSSPTAIPVAWLAGAERGPLVVSAGEERVRLLPGPTILFEITPLGVQSVAAAAEAPVWVLTCDERLIASCAEHRRLAAPLPASWVLLCDVEPEALADGLRTELGEDRPLTGICAFGGLSLGKGVWLLDHPPVIAADMPEPVVVGIDGRAHGDLEPEQELTLQTIAHDPGVHLIEVGEQEIVVEMAERGAREGIGSLAFDADARRILGGPCPTDRTDGTTICGPIVSPSPAALPETLIVRYRCTVDVIDRDGTVRKLAPPTPAAWLEHVGLPQEGPWGIPSAENVVWLCADLPGRQFVVAHLPDQVPVTSEVLDVVDWYACATQIIDRSGGGAVGRWQRLLGALEAAT